MKNPLIFRTRSGGGFFIADFDVALRIACSNIASEYYGGWLMETIFRHTSPQEWTKELWAISPIVVLRLNPSPIPGEDGDRFRKEQLNPYFFVIAEEILILLQEMADREFLPAFAEYPINPDRLYDPHSVEGQIANIIIATKLILDDIRLRSRQQS